MPHTRPGYEVDLRAAMDADPKLRALYDLRLAAKNVNAAAKQTMYLRLYKAEEAKVRPHVEATALACLRFLHAHAEWLNTEEPLTLTPYLPQLAAKKEG